MTCPATLSIPQTLPTSLPLSRTPAHLPPCTFGAKSCHWGCSMNGGQMAYIYGGQRVAAPSSPQSPIAGYPVQAAAVAPAAQATIAPTSMVAPGAADAGNAPTIAWLAVLGAVIVWR